MVLLLKDKDDKEYGSMKYWYREVPFLGEGIDLILARKVWSIIYWPIFLLSGYLTIKSINYVDWWHVFIFIPICWW